MSNFYHNTINICPDGSMYCVSFVSINLQVISLSLNLSNSENV